MQKALETSGKRFIMHTIYYFSGTGNTLKLARDFAGKLGDCRLIAIAGLNRGEEVLPGETDSIGIFTPVYCFGIPHIVSNFLKRIKDGSIPRSTYLYAVCCSGGMKGAAPAIIEDTFEEKGIRLTAAFHIVMPSNYLPLSAPPSERRRAKIFAKAQEKLDEVLEDVKSHKRTRPLRVFPIDTLGKFISSRAVAYLEKYDRYFWTDEKCDGCEQCEQLCPASNIIVKNGKPTWLGHCEQCMTCIQWCPKQSIQFRNLIRERYHNPAITVKDMADGKFTAANH